MFIKIPITEDMIRIARARYEAIGRMRGNVIEQNFHGFIGEEVYRVFVPDAVYMDTYEYDFCLRGKRVDVKTRTQEAPPKGHYEFSILQNNKLTENQEVDFFVFVVVRKSLDYAHVLGWLTKDQFIERSRFVDKGTVAGSGITYHVPVRLVSYSDLNLCH